MWYQQYCFVLKRNVHTQCCMQFQTKIKNLETQNPREFCNILKSETDYNSTEID